MENEGKRKACTGRISLGFNRLTISYVLTQKSTVFVFNYVLFLFTFSLLFLLGALKSRDLSHLTSRELTTRHQIKQIATAWTSVGPRKIRTCWAISVLNPVCHDSTAALTVACSFCVQSTILSALIRNPYSRGSTTEATARTKTRTDRRLCQQRQFQGRWNRQRQPRQPPRTTVAKCASWRHVLASHWCRADIEHVDSIEDDALMTKKTFRNSFMSQSHNQSLFYSAPKRCPESWPT